MSATKFHVNSKGEVGPCKAKVRCRFGGESGVENHFDTVEAAREAAQKNLQEEFSHLSSVRRGVSPQFIKMRDSIGATLVSYGIVENSDSLSEVASVDEIVTNWFGGDANRYESFRKIAETGDINDSTKKSIGFFVQKGLQVSISTKASEVPAFGNKDKFADSEIDLLDEDPNGKIDMEAVMRGEFRAFG